MKRIVVITGTPGVGKTSISKKLARMLDDTELINATDLVNKKKLYYAYEKGSKVVDMQRLKKEIINRIRQSKKKIILLEGHLLCDISVRNAKVIVLREHLQTLKKRLQKRGYNIEKIRENIISEATDYCGIKASSNYRQVFELLSSEKGLLKKMSNIINGKKVPKGNIELLKELKPLIAREKELVI